MDNYKMWIGGDWVEAESGKTITAVNPTTEEEIARIPEGGEVDVDKAVDAARKAFPIWSKKTVDERAKILNEIAATIRNHVQELAQIDVIDHGTPIGMATMLAQRASMYFQYAAEVSKSIIGDGEAKPAIPGSLAYLKREPIGVCACIVPWNVPLVVTNKIAAALATGNTCVVKPASMTCLTALKIAELLAENDLPPGTVNFVTGPGGAVGNRLASHPDVGMVAFTGGSEAGKSIMAAGSQNVKRLFLELGGKNPFIVLEDADLDMAVSRAIFASFMNSGMICASPGRYYLHEKIHDKFVEKFIVEAKKYAVGDPNDPKTQMGPVVSAEHRDVVEGYIKIGVEEGAKLVLGGKRPTEPPLDKGYFVMPTALTNVTQDMRVAREEIFGPVACFLKFSSEDEIIELANDTNMGLAASVWTRDVAKGLRYANQIEAGTVWVNNHIHSGGDLPWGGFKESGFGKEGAIMGISEYTQVKVISVNIT